MGKLSAAMIVMVTVTATAIMAPRATAIAMTIDDMNKKAIVVTTDATNKKAITIMTVALTDAPKLSPNTKMTAAAQADQTPSLIAAALIAPSLFHVVQADPISNAVVLPDLTPTRIAAVQGDLISNVAVPIAPSLIRVDQAALNSTVVDRNVETVIKRKMVAGTIVATEMAETKTMMMMTMTMTINRTKKTNGALTVTAKTKMPDRVQSTQQLDVA